MALLPANFYIIFSPAVLKNYPHTYITSFSTGEGQQKFSRNLLNTFPALTLIDVKQWIDQASQLIDQLIRAASLILGPDTASRHDAGAVITASGIRATAS